MRSTSAPQPGPQSGRRSRQRSGQRSGPWPGRLLSAAVLVSACAVGAGVLMASPPEPERPALDLSLATIETTSVIVPRTGFCSRIRSIDVDTALGAPLDAQASIAWRNGDPIELGGTDDLAHEFGCRWTSTATPAAVASAWVFAPPVTPARAATLRKSAAGTQGCTPVPGAAAFGRSSLALECVSDTGSEISYRGLFGDAWLVCTLGSAVPAPVSTARRTLAERWCASVLQAASGDTAVTTGG